MGVFNNNLSSFTSVNPFDILGVELEEVEIPSEHMILVLYILIFVVMR